jgi:hypothetical protein
VNILKYSLISFQKKIRIWNLFSKKFQNFYKSIILIHLSVRASVCPSRSRNPESGPRRTGLFFFSRPFSADCPGLIRPFFFFFFFALFQWAAQGWYVLFFFFFFLPFSGGLPRVNTSSLFFSFSFFFFFSPFSSRLPRVNTRVFFSRPFSAGCPGLIRPFFSPPFSANCPGLIPGFFFFLFLFFPPFSSGFAM